jgi:hypothetical protein
MSVSRVVFGLFVLATVAPTAGCEASLTVRTKTRFVENAVVREDTADWTGQPIELKLVGTGVSQGGGVTVRADASATKVRATARMLALAFAEDKAFADQSITEAKATFKITNSGGVIVVECGHGGSHGSSNSGESGCELTEVVVPAGDATRQLELKVLSGNGDVNLQLGNATLKNLGVNVNGAGDGIASLPATLGGSYSLVAEQAGDLTVRMPGTFSADEIILQADADKIDNAFTDAKLGAGAGGRGTQGTGLASLKLTSKEFAGSTGKITLAQQ